MSLTASSTVDPARQAQVALDELLRVLQAERAFLFTVTAYGELELRTGRSSGGEDLTDLAPAVHGVVEDVRRSGEPLIAGGGDEDERSAAAAPLLMKGELLGVVYVDNPAGYGAFSDGDIRILNAIANHIAIALQNASSLAQQTVLSRANTDLLEALRLRVDELQESRRQLTAAEERLRRDLAEMLCDAVHPDPNPKIGRVKDVTAGASALCEIGGGIVLLLVLAPHVLSWLVH